MANEFNLSDKGQESSSLTTDDENFAIIYLDKDVKEFIKRLKEKCEGYENYKYAHEDIDKLAGDKLI